VYDMYPWNEPDSGENQDQDQDQDQNTAARLPAPRDGAAADFTKAIQFALDRRDNGGDAAALPVPQPATPPAASLTRQ
jgi:hypothetical protein